MNNIYKTTFKKEEIPSVKLLSILIFIIAFCCNSVQSQTTIYSTDFGAVANMNPANWTFTGIDMTISTNTPSNGYAGVSGGAYLGEGNSTPFTNTSGTNFSTSQLGTSTATLLVSTSGYTTVTVGFGMRKSSAGYNTNATYSLEWSTDGSTYTTIPYTEPTAGSWGLASGTGLTLPAGAGNQPALYLKWTFIRTGAASNYKIDDFIVTGIAAPGVMRITEYMYNGSGAGSVGEYVEFTNVGTTPVDMTGWSFDDNSNTPGSQSLTAFGTVQPGESVIFTEITAATFRTNWALCSGVKVIGGNTNNLGREDEINLYNTSNTLVDRITYGDQTYSPGSIRTNTKSGWVNAAGLGTNTITNWALSIVGDAEASYASSLGELGSPGKSTRAIVPFDPCAIVNGAPTIGIDVTATTNYLDGGITVSPASPYGISAVIGDPTDPASTLGIDFTINDAETAIGALTVTATSGNISVVPNANIILTGSGASRNIKITPIAVGYSNISVTVNDGTNSTSYVISYAASIASTTPANTFWHTGISDGSDAIALDDSYYICGDDELDLLNVYSRSASGLPLASYDYASHLSLPDPVKPEVDLEAAAKSTTNTDKIYWLGSMSNGKGPDFEDKPNRNRIFATTQTGTGASTSFSFSGYYGNLRARLITWGDANGYNFTASTAEGVDSKSPGGFAAEGMVFGPDNTTLYIGLRAPLVPTTTRTNAVIAPILNFETWFNNGAPIGNPTFDSPIELNLGGRGFRDLTRLSNGTYIIVAGNPSGSPITSAIFKWTGNPADAPILVNTTANAILNLEGVMQMNVSGSLSLHDLQVITDGGDEVLYADGSVAKDFSDLNLRKFRSDKLNAIDLCMTSSGDTTVSACNSFSWYGTSYTSSGTPTRTVTTLSGCDSVVTLHLTINPLPATSVSASGPTILCEGDSVILSVAAGESYQWNLNGSIITGATANTYTTDTSGNYEVVVTNSNGCVDTSASQSITVNPLPSSTVTAGSTTTFCEGDSVTLSAPTGLSYQWMENGSNISGANSETYIITDEGNYNVLVNNGTCSATSSNVLVTVNPLPLAILTAGSDSVFCQGDSVVLTTSSGNSYQWLLNGSVITGANSSLYTVDITGNYSVVVTDTNTCSNTSIVQSVTENTLPDNSITAGGSIIFCQGDSVTLIAVSGLNYQWQLNGADIIGATDENIIVNISGTYNVIVSDTNCSNTSSGTIVTVHSIPTAPTITQSGTMLTASSASSYQWYFNDTLIVGAISQNYTVTEDGDYTVIVGNAAGCEEISAPLTVSFTGIAAVETENSVLIYPNPFTVETTIALSLTENATINIEVFDVLGKKVESIANGNYGIGSYNFTFNSSKGLHSGGIYIVKTMINNKLTVTRLVENK